jgi:hypothetical protein
MDIIDAAYLTNVVNSFLSGFSEDQISFLHFKDTPRLQTVLTLLYDLLVKNHQTGLLERTQALFQLYNQCQYEHRLANLGVI